MLLQSVQREWVDLTDEVNILPGEDACLDCGAQLGVGVGREQDGGEHLGVVDGGGGNGDVSAVPTSHSLTL